MNLIALNPESLVLGQPLPFAVRGPDGLLLANKGFVIRKREELEALTTRGIQLCIDTEESVDGHRAYLAQLQKMLITDQPLGEIASMQMDGSAQANVDKVRDGPVDWLDLQWTATQMLASPNPSDFGARFLAFQAEVARGCLQAPDATLLTLIQRSSDETRVYSATHAMLVASVCMLVARDTLRWSTDKVNLAGRVALSMNIAMTELQDRLAQQSAPLSASQISLVQNHAERSALQLASLGVTDAVWLEAVRQHHDRAPGKFDGRTEAGQIARLVQRIDIFAARLAPRAGRTPMSVTSAIKACYLDEERQVDDAGSALAKTLGIYPPGALVKLASEEVGVVIRRGATATTPRVAVVRSRSGMPTGELIPRDTAQAGWRITGVVAQQELRMQLPIERLAAMV